MRGVLALVLAGAIGLALSAQVAPVRPSRSAPPPLPNSLEHVDAVVTDQQGHPITDLKIDDFSVIEDGNATPVVTLAFAGAGGTDRSNPAVVPVASRADEENESGRDGARVFAIFLDEYHVAPGPEADRARELAAGFLRSLGPRDLAVVVKPLDSLLTLRLTHDRDELLRAVDSFEGRKDDYTPKNSFEKNYLTAAPSRNESVRSQIVASALDALTTHVGRLRPGRKTILVVSEGFMRPPRRRDDPLPTVESILRTANRTGVSIYAIDPQALAASGSNAPGDVDADAGAARDVLRTLTGETDGRFSFEPADISTAVPRMMADASAFYVLAFRPAHPTELRTLHPVEVRVKRPNAVVHARRGYWSASPDDLLRARTELRASIPVPPPQPMRHASALIHPWFGVARGTRDPSAGGGSSAMEVSFVWEAVPPIPGERIRVGPPALVSLKATRMTDGLVVFEGDVRPSNVGDDGLNEQPREAMFVSPPGRLLVEARIQDAEDHVLDTDVRDLIVGGLAGPVEIGTPQVFRAESQREFRVLDADPDAAPVAVRDFLRSDHLLIRIPVYGVESASEVTAALGSKGSAMRDLPIALIPGTSIYRVDFPLAGLVVGEYAVKIVAKTAAGDASDTVAFRVVP